MAWTSPFRAEQKPPGAFPTFSLAEPGTRRAPLGKTRSGRSEGVPLYRPPVAQARAALCQRSSPAEGTGCPGSCPSTLPAPAAGRNAARRLRSRQAAGADGDLMAGREERRRTLARRCGRAWRRLPAATFAAPAVAVAALVWALAASASGGT